MSSRNDLLAVLFVSHSIESFVAVTSNGSSASVPGKYSLLVKTFIVSRRTRTSTMVRFVIFGVFVVRCLENSSVVSSSGSFAEWRDTFVGIRKPVSGTYKNSRPSRQIRFYTNRDSH